MATASFGTIQEFSPASEPISAYLERLKAYLDANAIPNEKRSSILFVSVIGAKAYAVLRSLTAPATPQSKSYAALAEILKKHYEPAPLIIAERYNFNRRCQLPGESVSDYVAELRRLEATCKFGNFLDHALRDRLVCGLCSESARRQLLAEADGEISLARAIDQAQKNEQAETNAKYLKDTESSIKKLSLTSRSEQPRKPPHSTSCNRCGRGNHTPSECRFKHATCHFCKKKGHIAPACLRKKSKGATKPNVKRLATTREDSDAEEFHLFHVGSQSSQPLMVNSLDIEGRNVPMEVDTGAAFSIVSEKT